MDKWIWTVNRYFTPQANNKASTKGDWIFFYRSPEEAKIDKKAIVNPQEKPEEKENNPE